MGAATSPAGPGRGRRTATRAATCPSGTSGPTCPGTAAAGSTAASPRVGGPPRAKLGSERDTGGTSPDGPAGNSECAGAGSNHCRTRMTVGPNRGDPACHPTSSSISSACTRSASRGARNRRPACPRRRRRHSAEGADRSRTGVRGDRQATGRAAARPAGQTPSGPTNTGRGAVPQVGLAGRRHRLKEASRPAGPMAHDAFWAERRSDYMEGREISVRTASFALRPSGHMNIKHNYCRSARSLCSVSLSSTQRMRGKRQIHIARTGKTTAASIAWIVEADFNSSDNRPGGWRLVSVLSISDFPHTRISDSFPYEAARRFPDLLAARIQQRQTSPRLDPRL